MTLTSEELKKLFVIKERPGLICEYGHLWPPMEEPDVAAGQTCGALLYAHWDYPEKTQRCGGTLKWKTWRYYW
jgi:hypothetical protein